MRPSFIRALGLSALILAGCEAPEPLRDPKAPISSTTRLDPTLFSGRWVITASTWPELAGLDLSFSANRAGGFEAELPYVDCQESDLCSLERWRGTAALSGPGRLRPGPGWREGDLWILWIDADHRTAAIGTPSGRFAWIIEKDARRTPPDRMAAARDILDWAGYDLARLAGVPE